MIPKDRPFVIALGGNAISPAHAEGNIPQQIEAARATAVWLAELVAAGYRPVITHGNGPQVGNVLRRVELSVHEVYPLPLDICVADTQSGMGYVITRCLNNELRRRGIARVACTLVTCVEVDADDPALTRPSKPIGRFYPREQAAELMSRYGWHMVEIAGEGWRRVVPSPRPKAIVEIDVIRRLVAAGELMVTCGGGGIAVMRGADGDWRGVEAVIDKDLTAAVLARELATTHLVIVTAEPRVFIDYGRPTQRGLDRARLADLRPWLAEGQFPAGSMGPKIEAAIDFLGNHPAAGARVVICDNDSLPAALDGRAGTWIEP